MKGFTLLEVMIALIITGIAATALLVAAESGLHATQRASMYDQAIVRAKSRLAAATHGARLSLDDRRGDDGGGFHWRMRVRPISSISLPTAHVNAPRAASTYLVILYGITVWIGWNDGGTEQEFRLDTEQVGE